MDSVIVAEGISKRYGDVVALDDVSLSAATGEVVALIGPNGAGKTTLVRCLTGTTRPDDGRVRLLGSPPAEADPERIGMLPQSFAPPSRLTARELVAYYAGLYDGGKPGEALDAVGLEDRTTFYERLSGGQRRRACVATALVNDPDVLFLDEPTTGIDPAGRRALWNVFAALADAGTTILLTTHNMAEAAALADRVGLLADGGLVALDDPETLLAEYGPRSTLTVETDADPAALADTEFTVHGDERGVVLEDVEPADIGDVVRALDDCGVAFEGLYWSEPDLEDVYFALTGARVGGGGRRTTDPTAATAPGGGSR